MSALLRLWRRIAPRVATCWVCGDRPIAWLIEAIVAVDGSDGWDVEPHYRLCCDMRVCLSLSSVWAESVGVHADTRRPTLGEAREITGLELDAVTS